MYCVSCGTALGPDDRFCSACGTRAAVVVPQPMFVVPTRFIESLYPPDLLVTAGPGRRLVGYIIDVLLSLLTLGIGWLIWFIIVAPNGQTPAKQLLRMYIMRADGTRAGGVYTWVRQLLVRGLLGFLLSLVTLGVYELLASLWCVWDRDHQCLWDKIAGTYVAYSPIGYRPATAAELRRQGLPLPIMARGTAIRF
jgi:uncharacterized RDD family membrane protein YckC